MLYDIPLMSPCASAEAALRQKLPIFEAADRITQVYVAIDMDLAKMSKKMGHIE
jgi:hypothetical protein